MYIPRHIKILDDFIVIGVFTVEKLSIHRCGYGEVASIMLFTLLSDFSTVVVENPKAVSAIFPYQKYRARVKSLIRGQYRGIVMIFRV